MLARQQHRPTILMSIRLTRVARGSRLASCQIQADGVPAPRTVSICFASLVTRSENSCSDQCTIDIWHVARLRCTKACCRLARSRELPILAYLLPAYLSLLVRNEASGAWSTEFDSLVAELGLEDDDADDVDPSRWALVPRRPVVWLAALAAPGDDTREAGGQLARRLTTRDGAALSTLVRWAS